MSVSCKGGHLFGGRRILASLSAGGFWLGFARSELRSDDGALDPSSDSPVSSSVSLRGKSGEHLAQEPRYDSVVVMFAHSKKARALALDIGVTCTSALAPSRCLLTYCKVMWRLMRLPEDYLSRAVAARSPRRVDPPRSLPKCRP